MVNYNYKKNKLEQLRGFCAVVECKTIVEAAKKLHISESSISLQIASLEQDLKIKLFDKVGRNLKLNKAGKAYYIKAKEALERIEGIYGEGFVIKVGRFERFILQISNYMSTVGRRFGKFANTMLIKVTWKRFLISLFVILTGLIVYLYETNWFFDRKLKRLANPLLREVMEVGYYRISKKEVCPIEAAKFYIDVADLMKRLNGRKDVTQTIIGINKHPGTDWRMNGTKAVDEVFNTKQYIPCDSLREYLFNGYKHYYNFLVSSFNANSADKFKYYVFYQDKNCINYNIFQENLRKYPDQLIDIKFESGKLPVDNGEIWIITHGRYYYLILNTNVKQGGNDITDREERYLIFKKLTLNELMRYDNGSYWKLIKDYNINID